jgi:hypothetical protein
LVFKAPQGELPHRRSQNFNDAVYAIPNCYVRQEGEKILFKLNQLEWAQHYSSALRLVLGLL